MMLGDSGQNQIRLECLNKRLRCKLGSDLVRSFLFQQCNEDDYARSFIHRLVKNSIVGDFIVLAILAKLDYTRGY